MVIRGFLNKRGSAHLEIIMSFVIFVSFTLFLILSLEPTKQNLLEDSILFSVKNAFFDNVTTNVTSVLVDTRKENGNECPQSGACIPEELGESKKIIYNKVGESECLYYLFVSEEFSEDLTIRKCVQNENQESDKKYFLGYIEKQQVLSNRTLHEIKEEYNRDYNASKARLKVPEVVDFAIKISDDSYNYDLSRTIPDDAEVVSAVYRKKVLYENGSVINQDFIIKVW